MWRRCKRKNKTTMAETNVSVRFSVQDAETVRQALEKLGTDGEKALAKLNAAGTQPAQSLKAVSAVVDDLKSRMTGLAFNLGPVGTGLVALGPIGLAAAAALGTLTAALVFMNSEATRIGELATGLRNLSETTGLAATEIQGLQNQSAALGIENDKLTTGLDRFTAQLDQVHRAQGPLYEQILQINPAIADQIVKSRDAATSLNLLAQAYANAATDAQKASLANAAFGRGGIGTGRLLGAIAAQGGVAGVAANNPGVLTEAETKQFAELSVQIADTERHARDLMASLWTAEVLERQLQFWHAFDDVAKTAAGWKMSGDLDKYLGYLSTIASTGALAGAALIGVPGAAGALLNRATSAGSSPTKVTVNPSASGAAGASLLAGGAGSMAGAAGGLPLTDLQSIVAAYNEMAKGAAILGPAATSTETLALKQALLNKLVAEAGGRFSDYAKRAMDAATVAQAGADLQIKVQNNVATADELRAQRGAELNQLVAYGKLTQDEATQSLMAYEKVVEQTIEQEKVRAAALPQLQQLINSVSNLRTQTDTFATDVANNTNPALLDLETGAKSAKDSFTELGQSVAKSALTMLNNMTIVRAEALLLKSTFDALGIGLGTQGANGLSTDLQGNGTGIYTGPAFQPGFPQGSANGNVFSGGNIVPFAHGGIIRRPTLFKMANGGTGIVGEDPNNPEEGVLPLTRINGKLGVHAVGGGGTPVVNKIIIENHGADVQPDADQQNSGGPDIRVMVRSMVGQDLASGAHDQALRGRYGITRAAGRR